MIFPFFIVADEFYERRIKILKIEQLRAVRGPNYSHSKPLIFMEVNLEELETVPTSSVEGLRENIEKMIPSLVKHTCSPGVEGGFFQRVERGTWAGHVIEHVALELQNLIGHHVTYGKTYTLSQKAHYYIVFRYLDERVGLLAAEMAFNIVDKLFKGEVTDIEPLIEELQALSDISIYGPSTQSIVDEAEKRGITTYRLNENSYVQLGQGKFQRRIEATTMDSTSAIACGIAKDKERTKNILHEQGVPVPYGKSVYSLEEAKKEAESQGYPVVVKPLDGNHGRGVTTNITNEEELVEAFEAAKQISSYVIVERYLKGYDFRILVIDNKFEAAALREPAYVIGDGKSTVEDLIEVINQDPNRGDGHEKVLTKILINDETHYVLDQQGFKISDVIEDKKKVYVRQTANLSSGGTAVDVTDKVHPHNITMAERISRIIGLDVMGIDIIAETLDKPLTEQNAGIIEINCGPGFRMHLSPSEGKPRNVGKAVVDMLFPEGAEHSIPICAITGTNGKTTTTRLISHILNISGCVVGMSSTGAVVVNNIPILKGDYSGPMGAQSVMKDATVDHAVLEVARGGILRRGLGFKKCDVGVLLNVSSDHLGLDGIDTLEQLARVKGVVTESVKKDGYAVYNADDQLVVDRAHLTPGTPIFFSMDKENPILLENLKKGSVNVTIDNDEIVLQREGGNFAIARVDEVPITFDGQAKFNVQNVMAAVGATFGLGVSEEHIRAGLISFSSTIGQSPGRMNVFDIGDMKVVLDYGHNVGAVHATGEFLRNMMPGRVIRLSEGTGDRKTEDIIEFGQALAHYSDYHIIADTAPRGRRLGETAELMRDAMIEVGVQEENVEIILNETEAVKKALEMGEPGDLVILQINNIQKVSEQILDFKKNYIEKTKKDEKPVK